MVFVSFDCLKWGGKGEGSFQETVDTGKEWFSELEEKSEENIQNEG